jgi:uncharacterized MnhB-related membrane protein
MVNQITKGLIGKDDVNYNTSELYPTETFTRLAQNGLSTLRKFPDVYKTHYAIINACYWNSAAKNDTTLTQALSYIGSNTRTLYLESGTWSIENDLIIPANVELLIGKGAVVTVASGKTLTISGPVSAGPFQWIYGDGTTTITLKPQDQAWWGNTERFDVTGLKVGSAVMSAFVQTLIDDADAVAFLSTLGVSAFIQTLLDDADVATAQATLGFATATQAEMETAETTASVVTPGVAKYHPGVAKAWVSFNGTGSLAVSSSYNVNGVSDNGTGDYTVNWETDFSGATECVQATCNYRAGVGMTIINIKDSNTASATRFVCASDLSGSASDQAMVMVAAFGDQ